MMRGDFVRRDDTTQLVTLATDVAPLDDEEEENTPLECGRGGAPPTPAAAVGVAIAAVVEVVEAVESPRGC